jgi:hypothetical protein
MYCSNPTRSIFFFLLAPSPLYTVKQSFKEKDSQGNSKNKRQKYVADFVSWSFGRGKKKNCEVTKSVSGKQ